MTLAINTAPQNKSLNPTLQTIQDILAQPESQIDLAYARLTIEKILNPRIHIEKNLKKIAQIVEQIKQVPRYRNNTEGKLNGIVQYLYHSGKWNDYKPYRYDFDDPLGTAKPENSFLSNYLKSKTGNCVSMPFLVLIIRPKAWA